MTSYDSEDQSVGEGQPIGQLLDVLGVKHTMHEGDLITDAVVITKVVQGDGAVRLGLMWSEGISWIERLGLLHAALSIDSPAYTPDEE